LLVYSITSRSSFEEVSTFHQQILRVSSLAFLLAVETGGSMGDVLARADTVQVKDKDYFPVVVVANKCDLEYERQVQPHGRSLILQPLRSADLPSSAAQVCGRCSKKPR
jgi:GTPase KRas protein